MSKHIPVPASACLEIKDFGLRFSKELQTLTGERVRGRKLYNALVKPIGFDTHTQMVSLSKRVEEGTPFDFPLYLKQLKRELRKHLPVLVDGDTIAHAIEQAEDPGTLFFKVDGSNARQSDVDRLVKSNFYDEFRSEVWGLVRRSNRAVGFLELIQSREWYAGGTASEPVTVTFDYSQWRNETDPFRELPAFNGFLRMLSTNATAPNGVDIAIKRINQDQTIEILVRIEPNGKEIWKRDIFIVDVGLASKGLLPLDTEGTLMSKVKDPNDPLIAIGTQRKGDQEFHSLVFGPSGSAKSFLLNDAQKTLYGHIFNAEVGSIDLQELLEVSPNPVIDLTQAKGDPQVMLLAVSQLADKPNVQIHYRDSDWAALSAYDSVAAKRLQELAPYSLDDLPNAPRRIQHRINMLLAERNRPLEELFSQLEETPEVQQKLKVLMESGQNTLSSNDFWVVAKQFGASGTWIETGKMD